jgi:hypothetical protein
LVRRAIIHIGMPRSGSTTFQHILACAREELEKAGILYPDLTPRSAHCRPHISHQHFGETLDGRRPPCERQELLEALSRRVTRSDCDVVLLSYEDLIQQQPRFRVPQLLNSYFTQHGFTPEALVVVKPQSEHLNSIYTHRTQMMRERQGFAHFARGFSRSARFAYDRLIEPWNLAFSGRVRAVPVRDRRFPAAPLVVRMLTELRLYRRAASAIAWKDMRRVANRSPGPVAVEVSRRLRAMRTHARLTVPPRDMMRVVQRLATGLGYDRQKFNGVWPELRAEFDDRYRDTNERFAQTVWAQGWNDIVVPEPPRPVNELIAGRIDPRIEVAVDKILREAARQFAVTPCQSAFDAPLNLLTENFEALQRRLGISRWRVV